MKAESLDRFRWRMVEWLWTPPGKEGSVERPRRIDPLYLRGSRSRQEAPTRHPRKVVLPFRGKGAKTERRSVASRKRRKGG